jgi:hypothetical protein
MGIAGDDGDKRALAWSQSMLLIEVHCRVSRERACKRIFACSPARGDPYLARAALRRGATTSYAGEEFGIGVN